jgi:hypothetical protein
MLHCSIFLIVDSSMLVTLKAGAHVYPVFQAGHAGRCLKSRITEKSGRDKTCVSLDVFLSVLPVGSG